MSAAQAMIQSPARVIDLGVVDYLPALKHQHRLVRQRQAGHIPDTLLLLEHPPTITLGKTGAPRDLRVGPEELRIRGVEVHHVERGGKATAHEPGQLVSYFIFELPPRFGVRRFVRALEDAASNMLAEWDIGARGDDDHPGVWIGNRKIGAIGLAVSRGVTSHGMALNVGNDLDVFGLISPCGLDNGAVTSLARETGRPVSMDVVKSRLVLHLGAVLNREFENGAPGEEP
ncbi:MAG: lipoyl(octanoyl) transferase LipB [Proteobacteria bacterium]|nr:lipoyl(octanoyl) transferase LipB [Pseudomonadota bacterium]MBU1743049.1 lipoyl(octanoyl) transferase LipB [Pseudomonadota bacterium]